MISLLRQRGVQLRHWKQISKELKVDQMNPRDVTVMRLVQDRMHESDRLKVIRTVCEIATKEYAIQSTIEHVEHMFKGVEFELAPSRDRESHVLLGVDRLSVLFDEYLVKLAALKTNPYIKQFLEKTVYIERCITAVSEILTAWMAFQRSWIYLEVVFDSVYISDALPKEAQRFTHIDEFYRTTMKAIALQRSVHKLANKEGFIGQLERQNEQIEVVQEGLRNYLERKRVLFNRFFFLSNEELIAVYADQSSTVTVAKLMPKMFDGVEVFELSTDGKDQVVSICSRDLERITFATQVVTKAALPERWLRALEFQMTSTLKSHLVSGYEELLGECEYEEWVRKWHGQVSSTASFLWFTENLVDVVTKRHANEAMSQKRKQLSAFQEQVLGRLR